jgi:hypothetical protein
MVVAPVIGPYSAVADGDSSYVNSGASPAILNSRLGKERFCCLI